MIEVQHLTKRYGRVTAVDDLTFRVERGEILGFLGPNGAGKTTTMRILTGYMPATEGKAVVAGFDVFEQPIEAKRRTGYLPETPPLYPEMTVREYLQFVARIKIKGISSSERRSRVEDVHAAHARRRHGEPPLRQALEGLPPARRPRAGDPAQPRGAHSRRADRRPRSEADHRNAPAHQGAGRHAHDRAQHAHPPGSRRRPATGSSSSTRDAWSPSTRRRTSPRRLRGSETMYVQVDASGQDAAHDAAARCRACIERLGCGCPRRGHRLRDQQRKRPRHPPRSRARRRRRRTGACSSCARRA